MLGRGLACNSSRKKHDASDIYFSIALIILESEIRTTSIRCSRMT